MKFEAKNYMKHLVYMYCYYLCYSLRLIRI